MLPGTARAGRARLADVDRVACRAPELAAAGDVDLALARAVTADGVPCVCVWSFPSGAVIDTLVFSVSRNGRASRSSECSALPALAAMRNILLY